MGVPNVKLNSKVGKALAKTLGMTPDKLDRADGLKDGEFNMSRIVSIYTKQSSQIVKLRKRIIAPHHASKCENVYLVDNGDGKIGKGDLFLHADGYYSEKSASGYSYRMARLFAPRKIQSKSGSAARKNPKITPQENKWLKAFEALKGQTYASVKGKLKAVCKKRP